MQLINATKGKESTHAWLLMTRAHLLSTKVRHCRFYTLDTIYCTYVKSVNTYTLFSIQYSPLYRVLSVLYNMYSEFYTRHSIIYTVYLSLILSKGYTVKNQYLILYKASKVSKVSTVHILYMFSILYCQ